MVDGRLGVHQFTTDDYRTSAISETERRTQVDTAMIIEALNRFDTPPEVLVRMLETPPEDMYWFSFRELLELGLVGVEQNATPPVARPQTRPQSPPPVALAQEYLDCNRASRPSEFAICASPVLWGLDRRMTALYNLSYALMTANQKERLRTAQLEWLHVVDDCGADSSCIERQYRSRIEQLGG